MIPWLAVKGALGAPRWLLILGATILLLGAIAAVIAGVNHMLDNAKQAGREEVQSDWNAEKAGRAQASAELSAVLAEAFNGLDGTLQDTIRNISVEGQDITIRVKKEMNNDPRYTAAECALTDSVRREINAARGLSRPTAPTPVHSVPVSDSGAAVRFELGDAGGSGH